MGQVGLPRGGSQELTCTKASKRIVPDRDGLAPVDLAVIDPDCHRFRRYTVAERHDVEAIVARARNDQPVIIQEMRGLADVL